MSDMIKDTNHYTPQGWMVNQLGLQGVELQVYAILWGFSQDGTTGSRTPKRYFLDWGFCSDERTITKAINSLLEKGYVTREVINGLTPEYKCVPPANLYPLQKCTPSPHKNEGGTPCKNAEGINNNNINNREKSNTPALAREEIKEDLSFLSWWKLYNNRITWQENECAAIWDTFAPETRAAIMRHTRRIVERDGNKKKEPKWYLRNRQWENDHPKWFAGSPAECAAHNLVQVKWNDRYLITTREQAQAYNLEIIKDWK